MKTKHKVFSLIMAVLLVLPAIWVLTACGGGNNDNGKQRDTTAWFTSEELTLKGLTGLTAPVELTGDIYTYDGWYNNGYSFSQQCASKEIFEKNAGIYFEYFKNNYNGKFGVAKHQASNMETNKEWRYIYQKSTLDEYVIEYDKTRTRYRFYYVTDTTLVDGYYKAGAVKIFELVYDFDTNKNSYVLKIFIEDADKTHNGIYTFYYVMK